MAFDLKDFERLVKQHMEDQPYKAKCAVCGADLDYTTKLDNDLDLRIDVEPCKCTEVTT